MGFVLPLFYAVAHLDRMVLDFKKLPNGRDPKTVAAVDFSTLLGSTSLISSLIAP